uniref:Uncharacterized protein n=1 Tax=Aegilops tauschii TaxID=37682 RepID=M8CCH5_AEGTA
MDSVREEATLVLGLAKGCSKIMAPLLRFLGDEAAMSLLVVLTTAYLTGVILDHFAAIVLAYLHLTATTPCKDLARFVVLVLAFVSAWLLLAVAFYFLAHRSSFWGKVLVLLAMRTI